MGLRTPYPRQRGKPSPLWTPPAGAAPLNPKRSTFQRRRPVFMPVRAHARARMVVYHARCPSFAHSRAIRDRLSLANTWRVSAPGHGNGPPVTERAHMPGGLEGGTLSRGVQGAAPP
jgi:hypothetical protein